MGDISREQRVLSLVTNKPGLPGTMETLLEQLHRCQKALNEFLEEKRSAFPRFYFIGDDDLLEILGQATQPVVIQSHLKKLFAGIHSVVFSEEGREIIAMKSLEGETVDLVHPVAVTTEVEVSANSHLSHLLFFSTHQVWLQHLADEMKRTLQHLLIECVKSGQSGGKGINPYQYPSQVDHTLYTSTL